MFFSVTSSKIEAWEKSGKVAEIISAVTHVDPEVKVAAIAALRRMRAVDALGPLREVAREKKPQRLGRAASALCFGDIAKALLDQV